MCVTSFHEVKYCKCSFKPHCTGNEGFLKYSMGLGQSLPFRVFYEKEIPEPEVRWLKMNLGKGSVDFK